MTLNPVLVEALTKVAIVVIGAVLVAPLASALKRVLGESMRTVVVRLPAGEEVRLELDSHLSPDKAGELVIAAIRSVQSGDEAAIQRTIEASHAASREARAAAE